MNRLIVWIGIVMLAQLVCPMSIAAQLLGFHFEKAKTRVVIPVEVINNLIIVPAILNKTIPLKFVLDTGVRTTVLAQKEYSDLLGLSYSRQYTIRGLGGEQLVDVLVTDNITLTLPNGVQGTGHSMLVLKQNHIQLSNYLGIDVHGILGYELFSRFVVKMDYARKRITLYDANRFRKRKEVALPIKVVDTKPYVESSISITPNYAIDAKLLVDTGAGHGILLNQQNDLSITAPLQHINGVIGRGLGGVLFGKIARLSHINIGPYVIQNPLGFFIDQEDAPSFDVYRGIDVQGAIGGAILSRFVVTFDFSREIMYLKKNVRYKKKYYYNMSGLLLKATGLHLRHYEIVHVMKNSSGARADLRVGDCVVRLNGLSTQRLTLGEANGILESKEGKRISIEIERNGKRFRTILRLLDMI